MVDFNTAYRVRLPAVASCRVMLGSEEMEEVSEFLSIWEQCYVRLGGDHLGPNCWQHLNVKQAMEYSAQMIHDYVSASFY